MSILLLVKHEYPMLSLLILALSVESSAQSPPTSVRCEKPEYLVVAHVPKVRAACSWTHESHAPLGFRFEATLPSGLVTRQDDIRSCSTKVDLNCFTNYKIIVYARYVLSNGTEFLEPSTEIQFSTGACAPPEIIWYDHRASSTSVVLEWGLASMIYVDSITGYNLTLVPEDNEQSVLNFITPSVLKYTAHGLSSGTFYNGTLYPFHRARNGTVLKPRATVLKFRTQAITDERTEQTTTDMKEDP